MIGGIQYQKHQTEQVKAESCSNRQECGRSVKEAIATKRQPLLPQKTTGLASPAPQKAMEKLVWAAAAGFKHCPKKNMTGSVQVMKVLTMQAEGSYNDFNRRYKKATYTKRRVREVIQFSLFQVRILRLDEKCDSHNPEISIDCAYHVWK